MTRDPMADLTALAEKSRERFEGIAQMHPELMPGLVRHEGIGFIMVRSEEHGPLAISRDGVRNIETGEVAWTATLPLDGGRAHGDAAYAPAVPRVGHLASLRGWRCSRHLAFSGGPGSRRNPGTPRSRV